MNNNNTGNPNELKNIKESNSSQNNTKNDFEDNNLNTEKTEEDIIFQTNSCFDEQSFYKSIKDSINEETGFSKLSNNMLSSIHQNNNQVYNKPQNFDNMINADKYYSSGSKLKNRKIIKDFIERNNYVKSREYEESEEEEEEVSNNNINNNKYNNYKKFQNFLYREKRFQIKLNQNKERYLQFEDDALMNNIKLKPNICKKSEILANKKNKNTKVYQRLYQSPNFFTLGSNNKYIFKEDNNIKTNNNNNNVNKSQNISQKKYTPRKSKNDMKSLSSNNFYNKNEVKNNKNKNEFNNNKTPKRKETFSLSKNNSKKTFKSSAKIKPKADYFTINANKDINKAKTKSKNKNKIKYDNDKLYNSQSANDKMKIFELEKINLIIDDLLCKANINKEKKINFFLFCDLLFELGFVYILHRKKDNSEINEEYIKELIVQPYKDKSLITKEIIYNEIIIINNAFNSILNNFKLKKDFNIIEINNIKSKIKNNGISIEEFKLFIFILKDIFEGYEKDNKISSQRGSTNNIKPKNNRYNSSTHYTKNNKNENINNKEKYKKSDNTRINNKISKIITNINLEAFNHKDVENYRKNFKYMKDVNKEYILYSNNERKNIKKENLEKKFLYPFTFIPKTNNNNDLILDAIKPNMNFEERNNIIYKKKEKEKMDMVNQLNKELLQEVTFSPQLNGKKSINYFKKVNKMIEKEKIEKEEKEKRKKELNDIKIKSMNYNNINVVEPENNKESNNINIRYNPFNKERSDKLANQKISNLRKFNFMKRLNNFENNNREILKDDIKKDKRFLNYLLNNADEGRMNMGIERKSNKDTFDIFNDAKIKNKKKINEEKGYKSNVADILKSKNKFPLFEVEIKIKNENYNIEVFPKDNYENICLNFCREHGLGVESYNQILESIKKKIKEIDGYSINFENEKVNKGK